MDEITQTVELLRQELQDLVVRGLRTCGHDQVQRLAAMQEQLHDIGAQYTAGMLSELIAAIQSDDRRSAVILLQTLSSLRVFERILTLRVVGETLKGFNIAEEDEP